MILANVDIYVRGDASEEIVKHSSILPQIAK